METKEHNVPQEDINLFDGMNGKYASQNEEYFFKNMQFKEEYEITGLNDLLVSEYENDDEIYIVRQYYEEYLVGRGIDSNGAHEVHTMTLSEALSLNLKDLGFIDRNISLLDWLRECDYRHVRYNRNHDICQ